MAVHLLLWTTLPRLLSPSSFLPHAMHFLTNDESNIYFFTHDGPVVGSLAAAQSIELKSRPSPTDTKTNSNTRQLTSSMTMFLPKYPLPGPLLLKIISC